MEILAVIIGYLLGIAPFVTPKIVDLIQSIKVDKTNIQKEKENQDILDEWLNGAKIREVNQADIYNEYMTGEETTKGE